MTSSITYSPSAQRNLAARQLRAWVLSVAKPAAQLPYRANGTDVAWLALRLFPAALVFISIWGV